MNLLIKICDPSKYDPDLERQVIEWAASLGLAPADLRPKFGLAKEGGGWVAHFSQFERTDDGKLIVDRVRDEVVSRPIVVPLDGDHRPPSGVFDFDMNGNPKDKAEREL